MREGDGTAMASDGHHLTNLNGLCLRTYSQRLAAKMREAGHSGVIVLKGGVQVREREREGEQWLDGE